VNTPSDTPQQVGKLPNWLPLANRLVQGLHRLGVKTGTIHTLTVPGRRSGKLYATPISVLTVDGVEYTIGGIENADWVQNVRATGRGRLTYGRRHREVQITELPADQREPILRAFPIEVPHGTQFFERVYGVEPDPDQFATLSDRCPVFRIEDSSETV
jgi:deazaflavin-dependent oxidoreductase (nitroreductase family)